MKSVKTYDGYLVRCDIGEEVVSTLEKFATDNKIYSGSISGIGALKDVELGFIDIVKKDYDHKMFTEIYELVSFNGNFARIGDDIYLHCHAMISDSKFKTIGGHLFSAIIAVTGEFYIRPSGLELNRIHDEETGIKKLDL